MCQGGTRGSIDDADDDLFQGIPLVVGVDDRNRCVELLRVDLSHDPSIRQGQ